MNPLPSISLSSYKSPRRDHNGSSGYYNKSSYLSHNSKPYGGLGGSSHHKQHQLLGPSLNNQKQYIWSGSQYNQRHKHRDNNPYIKSSPRSHRQQQYNSKPNQFSNPYEPSPPKQRQHRHHHKHQQSSRHHSNNNYHHGSSPRKHRHHQYNHKTSPRNNDVPKLGLEGIWAQKTSYLQSDNDGPLSSRVHRKPRGIGHLSATRQPKSARVGGSNFDNSGTYLGNNHNSSHRRHKSKRRYVGIGTNHNLVQNGNPTIGLLSMPHSIAAKGRGGGDIKSDPPSKFSVPNNIGGNNVVGKGSLTITNSAQIQQNLENQQQKQMMKSGGIAIPSPPGTSNGVAGVNNTNNSNGVNQNNSSSSSSSSNPEKSENKSERSHHGDKNNERSKKEGVVMTPAEAFKKHMNELSDHEHGEILEYSKIYYCGNGEKKVRKHKGNNRGYDDDRGDYKIVMNDHIGYRFEIISTVGKGSFGQVVKCYDYKHNTMCALKIIRNKKRFHQQAKVEVNILKHLKKADKDRSSNIIHLKEHFYFRGHLCITFDLMSVNLYEFIKNNNFQGVSLGLIRRFAVQLLTSLKFLSSQSIIHCDLKPENILLKKSNRSGIRVIDLGSSCFVDERVYTYIQSRFYRAPEVILGCQYGTPIDMWSFACILAELYTGYPLFPGENEQQQLLCIMEIMGEPSSNMIDKASRKKLFFDSRGKPRLIADSRGRKRTPGAKSLSHVLKCKDKSFIDFLNKCLTWEPNLRYTAEQAMLHPWVIDGPAPPSKPKGNALPKIQSSRRRRH